MSGKKRNVQKEEYLGPFQDPQTPQLPSNPVATETTSNHPAGSITRHRGGSMQKADKRDIEGRVGLQKADKGSEMWEEDEEIERSPSNSHSPSPT